MGARMRDWPAHRLCWLLLLLLCQLNVFVSCQSKKLKAETLTKRRVYTSYGPLRGMLINLYNENLPHVEAYLGLQYASTHGGGLRFMPPSGPTDMWTGTRTAIDYRPVCPQKKPDTEKLAQHLPQGRVDHYRRLLPFLENQDEECLNLNIYVPERSENDTQLIPVVVFIHGESYDTGTGNAYDGSVMAAFGNIVVVTLNYRLGVLGFLSTGDSNAPGNYAILDQLAALHWINTNIQPFGGDPNQVTLLGQGYGAAMVSMHLISPMNDGGKAYFHRAIIQSGSLFSSWAITPDPVYYTRVLAKRLNCSYDWMDAVETLFCLKNRSYTELIDADIGIPRYQTGFGPVLDQSVFKRRTVDSLASQPPAFFSSTKIILGIMKNEGFLYFNQDEVVNGINVDRRRKMLRTYVRNLFDFQRQKLYEILLHQYTDWDRPADPTIIRDSLMELLGDGQYVAPLLKLAHAHAQEPAPTYLYSFSYPSRQDSYPRWAGGIHGDDLTYIFGAPLALGLSPFGQTFTKTEMMLTEAVMTYWTNFIKTGNPNEPSDQDSVHGGKRKNRFTDLLWLPYDNEQQQYLHIGEQGMRPEMRHHYRGEKMALWLDLVPKLHQSDNLPVQYHLLENYNNASSFQDGARQLDLLKIFPPPPLPPPAPPSTTTTTTPRWTTPTSTHGIVTIDRTSSTVTWPSTKSTTTSSAWLHPHWSTQPTLPSSMYTRSKSGDNNTVRAGAERQASTDTSLSLTVTIAVGCSLLFLNILMFAGVYYQKDRLRNERRQRRRQQNDGTADGLGTKEASLLPQDGSEICSKCAQETDTNSSSCMTAAPLPPVVRHMPQTVRSIPVVTPQPPYSVRTASLNRDAASNRRDYSPGRQISPRPARSYDQLNREDTHLQRSTSADSGTENHHNPNPVTMV